MMRCLTRGRQQLHSRQESLTGMCAPDERVCSESGTKDNSLLRKLDISVKGVPAVNGALLKSSPIAVKGPAPFSWAGLPHRGVEFRSYNLGI